MITCSKCDTVVPETVRRDRNGLFLCKIHRAKDRRAYMTAWMRMRRERVLGASDRQLTASRQLPLDVETTGPGSGRKVCTKCRAIKPLGAFSRDRTSPDGRLSWCKTCMNAHMATRNREIRHRVLWHYSGGSMQCACCEETELAFLALDHIYGDGAEHRRQVASVYVWLTRHGFPPGFQVLCHNCNMAKAYYGVCPHQVAKTAAVRVAMPDEAGTSARACGEILS